MSDDQILAAIEKELAHARKSLREMIEDGDFSVHLAYEDLRRSEKTQYACGRVDGLASLERKFRNIIEPEEASR